MFESLAPDEQRLKAMKYLVHLVGDVHQPLHAAYLDDKGGNTYQLQAFMRGSNLHAAWDTGLIRSQNEDAYAMAARLGERTCLTGVNSVGVAICLDSQKNQ